MPITNNPYCSLSDVKTALSITTTTDDAFITQLIPQAQAILDGELGFSFQQETATKLFDGSGTSRLFTGEIISFSQIIETIPQYIVNGFPYTPASFDVTSDCALSPPWSPIKYGLVRLSGEIFRPYYQNYSITGVFGFASVPPDITRACIRLVCQMYKLRDTNYSDSINDIGNIVQHFSKSLPADIQVILDNSRRRSFYGRRIY
jgi:hypothetical protein